MIAVQAHLWLLQHAYATPVMKSSTSATEVIPFFRDPPEIYCSNTFLKINSIVDSLTKVLILISPCEFRHLTNTSSGEETSVIHNY